jgi:hypothetical protein
MKPPIHRVKAMPTPKDCMALPVAVKDDAAQRQERCVEESCLE